MWTAWKHKFNGFQKTLLMIRDEGEGTRYEKRRGMSFNDNVEDFAKAEPIVIGFCIDNLCQGEQSAIRVCDCGCKQNAQVSPFQVTLIDSKDWAAMSEAEW